MEFKEAYKQALKEEIKPLIDSGKMVLLGTLEDTVEELIKAMAKGLKKGAILSDTPYDDLLVPTVVDKLEDLGLEKADKIDGEVG